MRKSGVSAVGMVCVILGGRIPRVRLTERRSSATSHRRTKVAGLIAWRRSPAAGLTSTTNVLMAELWAFNLGLDGVNALPTGTPFAIAGQYLVPLFVAQSI